MKNLVTDHADKPKMNGRFRTTDCEVCERPNRSHLSHGQRLANRLGGDPEDYCESLPVKLTIEVPRELLESLMDSDPCDLDHHGGCQTHGYLSLEPGEICPQAELQDLLSEGSE